MTKNDFMAGNYLHHELRKMLTGVFDVEHTNENGLKEAVGRGRRSVDHLPLCSGEENTGPILVRGWK